MFWKERKKKKNMLCDEKEGVADVFLVGRCVVVNNRFFVTHFRASRGACSCLLGDRGVICVLSSL